MSTPTPSSEALAVVAAWLADGRPAIVGRVIAISGFSTWPGEELLAVDATGERRGAILGRPGSDAVAARSAELMRQTGETGLATLTVEIHGEDVVEAGMSCGGEAEVLLQPSASIPVILWAALADRAPVAMITRIEGPAAGPASIVVTAEGRWEGALSGDTAAGQGRVEALAAEAGQLLAGGQSSTRRIDDGAGVALIESWVPAPRVVVVGDGDLPAAITAQATLLGWQTRVAPDLFGVRSGLAWGGSSTAIVVLSHDPELDAPALRLALEARAGYVGAMGSRRTQSRRLERLAAEGVGAGEVSKIHRPIGLDLGGRSAAEVALAIIAEILAVRSGRDGRSLRDRAGPIHERPGG